MLKTKTFSISLQCLTLTRPLFLTHYAKASNCAQPQFKFMRMWSNHKSIDRPNVLFRA